MHRFACTAGLALATLIAGCGEQSPAVVVQADPSVPGDAGEECLALHAALGQPFLTRVAMVEGSPSPELVQELDANKDYIDRLAYATRMDGCDWGIPADVDLNTTLPHLGKVRALARTLNVDARRLAAAGDGDRASRRVAGLVRLADHTAESGYDSIIEWLVGIAVLNLAAEAVVYCVPDFDAHQRGRVLAELQELDLDDIHGFEAKLATDLERTSAAGTPPANEPRLREAAATTRSEVQRAITALESDS